MFHCAWCPSGEDFINYWSAAVALFDWMILPSLDVELFHAYQERLLGHAFAEHNWSYPPHMLLMVWPFGQLPYLWALAAWSLLWLAFYLWASVGWRTDATILVWRCCWRRRPISTFPAARTASSPGRC